MHLHSPAEWGSGEKAEDIARALLFEVGILADFWGEAVVTAANILNDIPSRLLKWKSPYKKLHKKAPNYSAFHVFGAKLFTPIQSLTRIN